MRSHWPRKEKKEDVRAERGKQESPQETDINIFMLALYIKFPQRFLEAHSA